ncbi:hypothetical protein MNQ99_14645 [Arthrobacter sulfonylureivorans]|uniref:DUF4149 domain-containing protein n=1 Tax=Arthrobacter sulfonylureivorans TaxID=2486855 RepID=A0ABY3WA17_9MICC|nr:hypothetical protein [Arthrobacter sulfonylureivorans]UNK45167.1 hypothetical protein MNQ99_14645 [Arthrobacter sulfonylureivorans]
MSGNLLARSVHDLTAAAWFGGSLMGAVGLNGAAAAAKDPRERTRLSSAGWMKWAPVQTAAFAAHLASGVPLLMGNKGRMLKQEGVMRYTVIKSAVTLAGAAVTLYAGVLGKKVERLSEEGAQGATEPSPSASPELKSAQVQLKALQWTIPAFAGAVIVLGAKHGEMQRPTNFIEGMLNHQLAGSRGSRTGSRSGVLGSGLGVRRHLCHAGAAAALRIVPGAVGKHARR